MVFYSIGMYFLELEITDGPRSHGWWFGNECFCAAFFTIEYCTRWYYSDNRRRFPFKFLSIIDLIAVAPFFIGFLVGDQTLSILRSLTILRLFKLIRYSPAFLSLLQSLKRIQKQLRAVAYLLAMLVLLSTSLIYTFEHEAQPEKFTHPSDGFWFVMVTIATVGYGDLAPVTIPGRLVTVMTMILGIGIFGIFVSLLSGAILVELKETAETKSPE